MTPKYGIMNDYDQLAVYYGTQADYKTAEDFRTALDEEVGDRARPAALSGVTEIYARWCVGKCFEYMSGEHHFHVAEGPGRGLFKMWQYGEA